MEDNKIIALFFARSEEAIAALDRKYGRLCRSVSYNILHDRRDAEECVNDSYLGAWNAIPPQRPDPLRAFLLRIVRNLSITRYHANTAGRRSGYTAALDELSEVLAAPADPEAEVDARALARAIEEFLDGLSAENRVIFLRRYWFCDSYRQIAARVGLSEKNVSVRLSRTRSQLREFLTEKGWLP